MTNSYNKYLLSETSNFSGSVRIKPKISKFDILAKVCDSVQSNIKLPVFVMTT